MILFEVEYGDDGFGNHGEAYFLLDKDNEKVYFNKEQMDLVETIVINILDTGKLITHNMG